MYHKTSIQRLSPAQISKLLNGHRVRVKHGHGHEVHLSQEQHKKLHAAHRKGAGITMQLDPYQIQMHQHLRGHSRRGHGEGEGFFDIAKQYAAPVARAVAPALIDVGANALKNYASGHGEGLIRRPRAVRRGRGEGIHRMHHRVHHAPVHHAPVHHRRRRGRRGGALYPAGYGEGNVGREIGSALGSIAGNFLPF